MQICSSAWVGVIVPESTAAVMKVGSVTRRSTARFTAWSASHGLGSMIAAVRIVWRAGGAARAALSAPLPHTSPTVKPNAPSVTTAACRRNHPPSQCITPAGRKYAAISSPGIGGSLWAKSPVGSPVDTRRAVLRASSTSRYAIGPLAQNGNHYAGNPRRRAPDRDDQHTARKLVLAVVRLTATTNNTLPTPATTSPATVPPTIATNTAIRVRRHHPPLPGRTGRLG